eukprot:6486754-Amphidinium_carterae.1
MELPSQFRLFLRRVATALGQGVQSPMPCTTARGAMHAGLAPPLFPCGCPYPAAFRAGEVPRSPRRRERWSRLKQ